MNFAILTSRNYFFSNTRDIRDLKSPWRACRHWRQAVLSVVLFLLFHHLAVAQTDIPADTIRVDSSEARRFGLFNKENSKTFKILLSGKPAKAALFSLLIPGGGQAYNKRYWKIPVVWAVVGYTGYLALQAENNYREIDDIYKCLLRHGDCSYNGITDASLLAPWRQKARSLRERMWVTFSLVYFVQMVEAYIDRHLIDFDISEKLTFKPLVTPAGVNIGFSMALY